MPLIDNIQSALKVYYPNNPQGTPEQKLSAEQDTLRVLVGVLGVLLPIILVAGLSFVSGYNKPLASISHYFYTRVSSAFIITMSLLAVFLIVYKGKQIWDFILSTTAGVAALLVVFFPTTNLSPDCRHKDFLYSITYIDPDKIWSNFHFTSAAIFLICLAAMSIWRFPQNSSSDEIPKPLDKFMYRLCGIIILLAMAILALAAMGFCSMRQILNILTAVHFGWRQLRYGLLVTLGC